MHQAAVHRSQRLLRVVLVLSHHKQNLAVPVQVVLVALVVLVLVEARQLSCPSLMLL